MKLAATNQTPATANFMIDGAGQPPGVARIPCTPLTRSGGPPRPAPAPPPVARPSPIRPSCPACPACPACPGPLRSAPPRRPGPSRPPRSTPPASIRVGDQGVCVPAGALPGHKLLDHRAGCAGTKGEPARKRAGLKASRRQGGTGRGERGTGLAGDVLEALDWVVRLLAVGRRGSAVGGGDRGGLLGGLGHVQALGSAAQPRGADHAGQHGQHQPGPGDVLEPVLGGLP